MLSKREKKIYAKIKKKAMSPLGAKSKIKKNAAKMSVKMTWPEKEFKKMLKELKVDFEVQKILGKKIFDFYIPKYNLIVEVDGNYWHYNANTEKKPANKIQSRNIKNDKFKDALAIGMGYTIERVWESDLKVNYKVVKERFKNIFGA